MTYEEKRDSLLEVILDYAPNEEVKKEHREAALGVIEDHLAMGCLHDEMISVLAGILRDGILQGTWPWNRRLPKVSKL